MELRQYWNVIWKRRWLVLIIVGLVTVISAYMFLRAGLSYEGEVRFITRQEPSQDKPDITVFTFDRYYNWFGSEFLVDDYTQIVESDAFARSVLATPMFATKGVILGRTTGANGTLTTADVKGAMQADRKQRELRVKVTATSRNEAKELAQAVALVLTDARLQPINGTLVDDKPVFTQIDEATDDEIESSRSNELLSALIKVVIGLVAALALAFLLEYLDNSLRDERDAQRVLEMPVIGAIPRT